MNYYNLYLSNQKGPLFFKEEEAEEMIIALASRAIPKFILTRNGELVNTSYIISITKAGNDEGKPFSTSKDFLKKIKGLRISTTAEFKKQELR